MITAEPGIRLGMSDQPTLEFPRAPQTGHPPVYCHGWRTCPQCQAEYRRARIERDRVADFFGSTPVMTFRERYSLPMVGLDLVLGFVDWFRQQARGGDAARRR